MRWSWGAGGLGRLSAAGSEIHALGERTLQSAHAVLEAAREHSGEHHGSLIVATTHTQARYALPDVIRQFKQRYPDVPMGSYPFYRDGQPGTQLVLRSTDPARLAEAEAELKALLAARGWL